MEKFKFFIAIFYIIVLSAFLFLFFSKFSLADISSYKFIQINRNYFFGLKGKNIFILSFIFLTLTILWVFMLGFGSPVGLLAGFIFGKWLGLLLVTLGCSLGATFLYIFGNYFFKDYIKKKFLIKFSSLKSKFKRNELNFFLFYRFVGGIPFPIANVLPILFNVSLKNYFLGTFFGIIPGLFIIVSLGSGVEKIIEKNINAPTLSDVILQPEIYIPILAFFSMIIITMILKNYFYKD